MDFGVVLKSVFASDETDRLIENNDKKSDDIINECILNGRQVIKLNNKKISFNFYHFYCLILRGFTCLVCKQSFLK